MPVKSIGPRLRRWAREQAGVAERARRDLAQPLQGGGHLGHRQALFGFFGKHGVHQLDEGAGVSGARLASGGGSLNRCIPM